MEVLGPDVLVPWQVTYPSAGRDLAGYLFVPPGDGPFPALVINHGSPGIRSPRVDPINDLAEAMNRLGYVAFFPVRRGYDDNPGPHFTSFQTAPKDSRDWGQQTVDALLQETDDVVAAIDWLADQSPKDYRCVRCSMRSISTSINRASRKCAYSPSTPRSSRERR